MTTRYIVNDQPMDISIVKVPPHISVDDSGTGYGSRCLVLHCNGVAIESGIEAFRAAYPDLQTTSDRLEAAQMCRASWGGARPGAGRPPVNFRIPGLDPDVARWFATLSDADKIEIITQAAQS